MNRLLAALLLLSVAGCAEKDPMPAELGLWTSLPQAFIAVDAQELRKELAEIGKFGAKVSPSDLEMKYLYRAIQGRSALGDGPLVLLFTDESKIPSGVSYLPMRRLHALSEVLSVDGAVGACVDGDARSACRTVLSNEQVSRLIGALVPIAKIEEPLPFKVLQRP